MPLAPRGTTPRRRLVPAVALGLTISVGSCGFGTGGVIAAAGGGGGSDTNAPATPAGLVVLDAKRSPARLRIVMTDAEADRSLVEFFYVLPGETTERPLTKLPANPVELSTSRVGVTHDLVWDFAGEAGLPASGSFVDQVTVIARTRDGLAQSTVTGLGNDAPVVGDVVVPANEVTGIADVSFVVRDTSGDAVDIEVEFFDEGAPQLGWRRARPAGSDAPGAAAFRGVNAPATGERLTFFWDTNSRDALGNPVGDLVSLERAVRLRFRPTDSATALVDALPTESATFQVDNNEQPLLQVNNDALLAGGDRRRTVAVPITVSDAESDLVTVVMQWRRIVDAGYPDLGTTDPDLLRMRLQDDRFVREKQICRTRALAATGTANLVDARRLRTDAFARSQAFALTQGIVGRELEILRPHASAPVVASSDWATNPLTRPVAVLSARSGTEATVLDDLGGAGRVLVVDTETGAVLRTVAAGIPGTPTAMCRAVGNGSLLVASHATTGWLLHEVSLVDGTVQQRAAGLPPLVNAPIRGVAAQADRIALITVDTRVLRVDWNDAATPSVRTQLSNLSEPSGLLFDPNDRNLLLVAERTHQTNGRVAAWNLRTGLPTGVLPAASAPVRPSALALSAGGRELLVLGEPLAGGRRLHRFVRNAAGGALAAVAVPSTATSVAGDRDGAWMVVDPASRQLAVQGGVRHRRVVTAYDPATMVVTLDADIPTVPGELSWRIEVGTGRDVAANPTGRREVVLWDTADVAGIGPIALRTFAIDSEFGPSTETAAGVAFLPDEHDSQTIGSVGAILDVADLDGDGDLDLNGGAVLVRQVGPRAFAAGGGAPPSGAATVFDANGDGRNDLISFPLGVQILVYHQNANGTFPSSANLTLDVPANRIADLNGDGRFDAIVASGGNVTIRLQNAGGSFAAPQTIPSPAASANVVDVGLVDLTGDGLLDVSIVTRDDQIGGATFFDTRVFVYAQGAGGTFPTSPTFQLHIDNDYAANLVDYGDVDGDGRTDVLLSQPFVPDIFTPVIPDHITVLFQGPAASFTDRFRYDKNGAGFLSIGLGDVDGDGLLDILAAGAVLQQRTPRQFVEIAQSAGGRPFTDVDGDGAADEVAGNTVRFRRGPGRLGGTSLGLPGTVLGDFNGDGLLDAADSTAGFTSSQVSATLQQPGLAFPPAPDYARSFLTISGTPPSFALQAGDVSGDGIVDLVTLTVSDPNSIVTAEPILDGPNQPGPVSFATPLNVGSGLLSLRDFDADGRLDLVAAVQGNNTGRFHAFRRTGTGLQQILQDNLLPAHATSIAWGDLDGDGRTDLVVGLSDGRARVYRQNTAGSLSVPATVLGSAVASPANVTVVDLDGDGRHDLLLGTPANGLRAFYGTGSGVPASSVVLDAALAQSGAADVDGDGDLDVVLANGDLLMQTAPRVFLRILGPFGVDVDFDLDGELDDLSGNSVQFGGR